MTSNSAEDRSRAHTAAQFATTHWSAVLRVGGSGSPDSREALEKLCRTYWYPLYVYVRRLGHSPAEAEDLTQGFFVDLLGRDFLRNVAREKGRFRSFLLACLNHFLSDQRDRAQAAKRGRGRLSISLDADLAERRCREGLTDGLTPEIEYERRWAATLLEHAQNRLAEEYAARGKTDLLHLLQEFPLGQRGESSFRDCSVRLGLSESALKSAVHRMRRRYRKLVREEVAHTVNDPAEVEAEIRHLIGVVSG